VKNKSAPAIQIKGFVRTKRQGWRTYHYLVRNERVDGRVRQRVIAYLGKYPTVELALERLTRDVATFTEVIAFGLSSAERWRQAEWWSDISPGHSKINRYVTEKRLKDFRDTRKNRIRFHLKRAHTAAVNLRRAERHLASLKKALNL
jgi:hypothetical protein